MHFTILMSQLHLKHYVPPRHKCILILWVCVLSHVGKKQVKQPPKLQQYWLFYFPVCLPLSNLFFFFRIVLTIISPFPLCINLRILLLILTKKKLLVFDENYINPACQFEENWHLYCVEFNNTILVLGSKFQHADFGGTNIQTITCGIKFFFNIA